MSHSVNLFSNLQLNKSSKFLFEEGNTEFPTTPVKGEFAFVSGILYMYTSIRNIETWYPLTNLRKSYVHIQEIVSQTWTINHNLGSTTFIFMVYDSAGNLVLANLNDVLENSFVLNFDSAISGKVVMFADVTDSTILSNNNTGSTSTKIMNVSMFGGF